MKKITILVPCYNEEEIIEIFYKEMIKEIDKIKNKKIEILFVNDGSKDETLNIIKGLRVNDKRITYINLSRNYGKEIAMCAGFDNLNCDAVIIMDADLQHPPKVILEMIKEWDKGLYDDIYAKRTNNDKESFFKIIASKMYYKILSKFSGRVEVRPNVGDFRLLSNKAIQAIKSIRETNRYTKGLFDFIGFKKKEIYYDRIERIAGTTKWKLINLIELAIEGITSYTIAPLRIATILGISISICAFLWAIYIGISTLIYGNETQGFTTLSMMILFMGGVQLLTIGIIGEYLGKIFIETKNRPLYFIDELEQNILK